MKIVIIGDGKVGFAIAKQLSQEGYDLTIIENKPQVLNLTMDVLDVVGVQGNGGDYDVLKEAQVNQADLVIAVTSSDEINIISCLMAKKMGADHTIARIRNPEYVKGLRILKEDLGLSMQINPEQTAAREIVRSLSFPNSIKVNSFAKGRLELAEIRIREENSLAKKTVHQIDKSLKSKVQFVAIKRNDNVLLPTGNTVIELNDKVTLTGSTKQLKKFLSEIGIIQKRTVHEIMIIGGSKITFYLIPMLLDMGIEVKVIEIKEDRCMALVEKFPQITVIHGDGTDHELLLSESLREMDAFIALTDIDEENVIISMFAHNHGVPRVLPKVNRVSLGFLLEKLGLENTITPKNLVTNQIIQYVRAMQNTLGSNVKSLIKIVDDQVEILEFRVRDNCKFIDKQIKDLKLKDGILISYIIHKSIPKIANGNSVISLGDTVIITSHLKGLRDINDVLA
ncbi:Trk system potassium transporter TrkA [Thomasclavelia spiroformis]|uniref:Trk system potassium transporter TrkA n=1 Tax=Thomasclavelia spiroformis TaxID=29348 RepID=UPI0026DCBD90|nr:Trk system potassium transporter TrkA [Thomasclavelia spiroformis]